jgi:hypothetical protein
MERANVAPDAAHSETTVSTEEKQFIAKQASSPPMVESACVAQQISQNQLINSLNLINFLDKPLYVNFRHKQYQRSLSIKAKPQPCQDDHLTCVWQQDADSIVDHPDFYVFENIIIPDGQRFLVAEPDVLQINHRRIRFILPETGSAADARSTRRHQCQGINVYVTQNGALFYGSMIDFSAFSFRVQVKTAPPQTFDWIDTDMAVNVILFDGNRTLYSGECDIVKQTHGQTSQSWIVSPVRRKIRRFRPKEFRSTRQQMNPLPTVRFKHPFSKKSVHLEVLDLSGSGLAVREEIKHAVLMPGLIIPNLQICFSDGAHVTGVAQVVYSQRAEETEGAGMLRCGIAILDMPADQHIKVLSLIHQTNDKNAYLCHRVNQDDLWNFFFDTGFIYPQKYEFIEKNKDRIKKTYKKLYTESPTIARHFIHQRNGVILGHMAMVRFYGKAWLIHHHAALRSSANRGGLAVLNQIGSFINDSHRLNSIKMSYVFCYYRPDNKFPNHVFGGAQKNIMNPKGCSIDRFAYFHLRSDDRDAVALPHGWELEPTTDMDLRDLECHYEDVSGGLMIHALDLEDGCHDIEETQAAFERIGLVRERHLYSLKLAGVLKAVIILNLTDIGLNMSDLTNSMKVIILKQEGLTFHIIRIGLLALFRKHQVDEMPVLAYPATTAAALDIPCEKIYNLWILSMNHTDDYFRYLKRLLKFIKH